MNMSRIPRPDAAAKFISQLTRGGSGEVSADRLRQLGLEVPSDDELNALWHQRPGRVAPAAANRRQNRAQASADRKSDVLDPPAPHELAKTRRYREKLERRSAHWEKKPEPTAELPFWRMVEQDLWIACKDIVAGGAPAVKFHFSTIRSKSAIGAMRRAALCPLPGGGTLRSWSSLRARRIAALAYAQIKLAKHTARKGPWGTVVRGIPQEVLLLLLAFPDGTEVPSRSALVGRHRGPESRSERGELGYLRALESAGFLHSQQWYPDAQAWELSRHRFFIGADGRKVIPQINRYWIVSDPPRRGPKRADLIELNREGWLMLSEQARGQRTYAAVHGDSAENPVYSSVHPPD